jgi:hypothetical protein
MVRHGITKYIGYTLVALLLIAGAALFYFGGFNYLLSNQSSSFSVELALTQSRAHRDATVIVLGNSTAAEDFHANRFNARAHGETALNLGVPAAHLYFFDRILSASIAEGVRPQTVVLIVTPEILSLRPDFDYLLNDLTMLKTELNAGDLARLASHSRDLRAYLNYASYVAARPVLFRGELRDFFAHPTERLKEAAAIRGWLASFGPRSPMTETDNSFSVCDAGPLPALSQTIARLRRQGRAAEAADVERVLPGYAARVHQPLHVDAFETRRFRRLLQRLAARSRAVFVVPAPYYDPDYDQYPLDYRRSEEQTIREVAAGIPKVKLLPPFSADCRLFFDTVHLNHLGAEQFTDYLYTRVL